jgi:ribosome maturation factor RimP
MARAAAEDIQSAMSWQQALEHSVTALGYDLVDVERSAGGLLRVTIDRLPGHVYANAGGDAVTVEDCEIVTRQLQYLLEVEGVDYARLEVSSPGLDRPLKKPADWQRFTGAQVEVTLREPFQNRRRWRGTLVAGDGDTLWRLVLPAADSPATPTRPGARPAKPRKPAPADASVAPAAKELTLDFSLDEVREARLVPVVDFKGRRGQQAAAAQADGGQE